MDNQKLAEEILNVMKAYGKQLVATDEAYRRYVNSDHEWPTESIYKDELNLLRQLEDRVKELAKMLA